jgi:hypothetical protein
MYGKLDVRYVRQLADARATGEAHDYHWVDSRGVGGSHFEGWRSAKDNAVCALFVQGKATVAQAVAANVRPKELIMALDRCTSDESFFALAQEMVANDIDVLRLNSTRKRLLSKLGYELKVEKDGTCQDRMTIAQAEAQALANAKSSALSFAKATSVTVKKADGRELVMRPSSKPLTKTEIEVAVAMAEHESREVMKKKLMRLRAEKARLGVEVTPELQAEIMARTAAKGKIVLK